MNSLNTHLKTFQNWMRQHIDGFYGISPDQDKNIRLKDIHTRKVYEIMEDLCRSEACDEHFSFLALTAALFHDLGRFTQYAKYHTFRDSISEDHAALSARLLENSDLLNDLPQEDHSLIIKSITYHNRATLPAEESPDCLRLTTFLRDADKLDIFRVVTEYYLREDPSVKNTNIELDLPDTAEISPAVLQAVREGSVIYAKELKTLNDFKILQMNWVSDLHLPRSFEILRDKNYLQIIRDSISHPAAADLAWQLIEPRLNGK